jgi:hypothetical protein
MTGPLAPRPFPTTRPPPTESLAELYFTPLVAPTPVATRLPRPADTADTINAFLRIEAGGGVLRPDGFLWDVSVILHAYAPWSQEPMAEHLIGVAVAWGANAQGTTTVMPNGDKWYVTFSQCTGFITRKADPMVNLARYRAMVSWRVPGIGVEPGASWLTLPKRAAAPEQSSSEAVAVSGSDPPRPTRRRSGPQH